jgi:RNA-binding protein NOB1
MESPASQPLAQEQIQTETENPAPTVPDHAQSAQSAPTASPKPVHSLVIDANAIIKNDPTVSTLLAQAEELYTIPAVVSESTHQTTL